MIEEFGDRLELSLHDWSPEQVFLLLVMAHLPIAPGKIDDFPVAIERIGKELPWVLDLLIDELRGLDTRPDGPELWQMAQRVAKTQAELKLLLAGRCRHPLRRPGEGVWMRRLARR